MRKAEVYSTISKCFAPIGQDIWGEITSYVNWSGFLESCRIELTGGGRGSCECGSEDRRENCPLQEFLSRGEIDALYSPPVFEEKQLFAARHFTGGLPESVRPIESLYVPWTHRSLPETPFARKTGLYLSDAASYMQAVIERLGMQVPDEYRDCPDHLSLELDLLAVLERSGMAGDAGIFFDERFQWLTAYRTRLLQIHDDARFYVGLVDVLIGMYSNQEPFDDAL